MWFVLVSKIKFTPQNCVETSFSGHSSASLCFWCWVLYPVLLCETQWGWSSVVQFSLQCSASVHWLCMWFAPVCIVGVLGGCLGRLALPGRPGLRSVCVSLFHVKNPVQWTRNYQRRGSLSGTIAFQTFTKVTESLHGETFAHKQ